ncbi:unnamed protein product, partial [Heterosigma akashiwo]
WRTNTKYLQKRFHTKNMSESGGNKGCRLQMIKDYTEMMIITYLFSSQSPVKTTKLFGIKNV